jgi:hypothetical protein
MSKDRKRPIFPVLAGPQMMACKLSFCNNPGRAGCNVFVEKINFTFVNH